MITLNTAFYRMPLNYMHLMQISLVHFSSVTQSCLTLCDPMNHSTPGLPFHHQPRSSLRLMSIESVMPFSHLILGRPLLLLPPISPSIRVFSNKSALRMRWPKYWSFKSEFGNKEFRIWATVSSRSCFCWLYRTSPSLAAKNIINLISVLTI